MNGNRKVLAAALAAFAGGLFSGLLLAPQSGKSFRSLLFTKALVPAHWVEGRFHDIEQQLVRLEQQLAESGHEFGERLRDRTKGAVDQYISSVPDGSETWDVDSGEITRELGRMPRA